MKIEIDVNKIAEKINVNKVIEERILSDIMESSKLEDIVNDILESEDMQNLINKKTTNIIEEYLSSDEGKKYITEKFEEVMTESDILADEKIIELIAEFLKKSLIERS